MIDQIYRLEEDRAATAVTTAASGRPLAWIEALADWARDGIGDRRLARATPGVSEDVLSPSPGR